MMLFEVSRNKLQMQQPSFQERAKFKVHVEGASVNLAKKQQSVLRRDSVMPAACLKGYQSLKHASFQAGHTEIQPDARRGQELYVFSHAWCRHSHGQVRPSVNGYQEVIRASLA